MEEAMLKSGNVKDIVSRLTGTGATSRQYNPELVNMGKPFLSSIHSSALFLLSVSQAMTRFGSGQAWHAR